MSLDQLLKNKELVKAILLLVSLVVLIGAVVPVLVWAVLNTPPESLGISLGVVYLWWAALWSGVLLFAAIHALTRDRGKE